MKEATRVILENRENAGSTDYTELKVNMTSTIGELIWHYTNFTASHYLWLYGAFNDS